MTPRPSSRNGSLCCLFGDVTFLLVGLLHFGGDFHRHFYFGFLAGISDLGLQLSSLSKLHAAHRSETFQSLAGMTRLHLPHSKCKSCIDFRTALLL